MRRKILVVDDEPDVGTLIRQVFRKAIKSNELEFLFAANGKEALEKVRTETELDLLITDINMPELDGLTLLSRIKELIPSVKSVVLSAYDDRDNIRAAMNSGAFDFITKPMDANELEITINNALQNISIGTKSTPLSEERPFDNSKRPPKSRFLSIMSHEMRTPLNTILGITELLEETELNAEQRHYIHVLNTAGESLLDIVNDILDLSKIEAGRLSLEHVDFDMRDLIRNIMRMMAVRMGDKNIHLTVNVSPHIPEYVTGDPGRLRQVLVNLIENAIKFTKSGEVKLDVRKTDLHDNRLELLFCITDTGIGIPDNKLDKIFDIFSQVDPSTARHYGGTGLGLAICKSLVKAMKGRIWVESRLHEGSSFYFTVAIEKGDKASEFSGITDIYKHVSDNDQTGTPRDQPLSERGRLRILLVDDSEHNRMVIEHHLHPFCQRIDCAENGQVAFDLFVTNSYDLVFMDIQMPIMDGHLATQMIRKWERENDKKQTPIIGLTAYTLKSELEAIQDSGCTETQMKPMRKSKLLDIIRKFCPTQNFQHNGTSQNEPKNDVVHVPMNMKELVQRYVNELKREVMDSLSLLEKGDFETVKIFGHRLKGSGEAYGFEKLTHFGDSLEQSATGCQTESTQKLVQEIQTYLDNVRVVFY